MMTKEEVEEWEAEKKQRREQLNALPRYYRVKDNWCNCIVDIQKRFSHLDLVKTKKEIKAFTPYLYIDFEEKKIYYWDCYRNCDFKMSFTKASNKFIEVCDEFVVWDDENNCIFDIYKTFEGGAKDFVGFYTVKGSIYTDEGLIYQGIVDKNGDRI